MNHFEKFPLKSLSFTMLALAFSVIIAWSFAKQIRQRELVSNTTQSLEAKWQTHFRKNAAQVSIENDFILVRFENGDISAFNIDDGTRSWTFQNKLTLIKRFDFMQVSELMAVSNLGNNKIIGLDLETGETIWQNDKPETLLSLDFTHISDDEIVIGGLSGNYTLISNFNILSGRKVWQSTNFPLRSFRGGDSCLDSETNQDAFCLFFQGKIIMFDPDSRSNLNEYTLTHRITSNSIIQDKYIFVSFIPDDSPLSIINFENDKLEDSIQNCDDPTTPRYLSRTGDIVQISTSCGEIFHASTTNGKLLVEKIFESEEIASDLKYDGDLGYFISKNGSLVEINLSNQSEVGKVITKPDAGIATGNIVSMSENFLVGLIDGKTLMVFTRKHEP